MKLSSTFKSNFIYAVALLHILVFTYAAVSKILDFQNFKVQLGQSPLLTIFATFLSFFVPAVELGLTIVLMIPKYRIAGIYASYFLMFLFTIYIVMILHFTSFVPCSCGGVLEKLGWTEHFFFNVGFLVLGAFAIFLNSGVKHTIIVTIIESSIGIIIMVILFLFSEEIMHKENPFIRRFPQGAAVREYAVDLRNYSSYISGLTNNEVYLANLNAPLQITVFDSSLKNKKIHTIQLENENFPFKALRVKVIYPNFYLYDKTVPVIYKGLVSDWKAKVVSDRRFRFSDIVFINANHVIIRAQKANTPDNVLAVVNYSDTLIFTLNDQILQKQFNSIFDTDGTMNYSFELNQFVYTYYYRNQYTVTDENLKIQLRGNTIDTTTKAKIEVVKIEKSGDTKLAAPPYMVNNLTTVVKNLLFINSKVRGRFENDEVWKHAAAVDIYDITTKEYILSFYVHDEEKNKMKDFLATKDAAYIVSGHYLLKYKFGQRLKAKFKIK